MRTSANGRTTKIGSGAAVKTAAGARRTRRRRSPGGDRASWKPTPFVARRTPAQSNALKPRAALLERPTQVDCRKRRQNGKRATAIDEMVRLRLRENP